jgi:hypothetical protein
VKGFLSGANHSQVVEPRAIEGPGARRPAVIESLPQAREITINDCADAVLPRGNALLQPLPLPVNPI